MIQKAQNYSAYSELLNVFKITQRIQNYSTYSELLHVFRITQRIHFLRGRAERRARNVSHLDRPWGVLSAYHALILVRLRPQITRVPLMYFWLPPDFGGGRPPPAPPPGYALGLDTLLSYNGAKRRLCPRNYALVRGSSQHRHAAKGCMHVV